MFTTLTRLSVSLSILLCSSGFAQQEQKKEDLAKIPQWQRRLAEADEKKAAQLRKQLVEQQKQMNFEKAISIAKEIYQLRSERQGTDHWETIKYKWELQEMEILYKQSKEKQKQYAETLTWSQQAKELESKGQWKDAIVLHEKAIQIRQSIFGDHHPSLPGSYNNLGFSHHNLGNFANAESNYRKAFEIYKEFYGQEHPATATIRNNIANVLQDQGRLTEAEIELRESLRIIHQVLGETHPNLIAGISNLSTLLLELGRFEEAEQLQKQTLSIVRTVYKGENANAGSVYNNMASILIKQGKYAEAAQCLEQAYQINQKVLGPEHTSSLGTHMNIAANEQFQSKFVEAEEKFRSLLKTYLRLFGENSIYTATVYANLAACLSAQGKFEEADSCWQKALRIRETVLGSQHPTLAAAMLSYSGFLQNQERLPEAESWGQKSLAIYKSQLGDEHINTAAAYYRLGSIYLVQGLYAKAEKQYQIGSDIQAISRLRFARSGLDRASLSTTQTGLGQLSIALARQQKYALAWQRLEESLARGTWDDLSSRTRREFSERSKEDQLLYRLSRLDLQIERLATQKDTSAQRKEQLLQQRHQAQEDLQKWTQLMEQKYGPIAGKVYDLPTIQASIPKDSCLLTWIDFQNLPQALKPYDEHWAVILKSQGEPIFVPLPGSGPDGKWVLADKQLLLQLKQALQDPSSSWKPYAQKVRKQRLEPVLPYVKDVQKLIILPCNAMTGIPIETLTDDWIIQNAPSGTIYAYLKNLPQQRQVAFLGVGDPAFERGSQDTIAQRNGTKNSWPDLPGTRIEVEAISKLFDPNNQQILLDSQASEQQLHTLAEKGDLAKYRYIHLATHGSMNATYPLRSAVILSQDQLPDPDKQFQENKPIFDGQLTAEKILRSWNLQTDLVTLSACESGLGKLEVGEGYVGFSQTLILAGSRSVCLSLWKVDDQATALLMHRFYQNLLGKRTDLSTAMKKNEALTEAKQWLRNLSKEQITKQMSAITQGVSRGKGRPALPGVKKMEAEKPFAHPYYWAAFIIIGDGD